MSETFAALGVPAELVEALRRRRITEPFEIQSLSIPDALAGRDLLGRAPTGSGKTLAFGVPALARLADAHRARPHHPRGLILSPTRELAEQISRELEPLAAEVDRRVLAVYGGVSISGQVKKLSRGVDVLVACPGRLLDLIEQGEVALGDVEVAVVDEADRMADMGFLPDVRKILDHTSPERQTILFSATLDRDVQILIDNYQRDPIQHQVAELEPDLSTMAHRFIKTPKTDRVWLAADLIAETGPSIVFVRTRHGVDRLSRQLGQEGIRAGYLHGGRSQSQRDRALEVFTEGKVDALIATDVAARGIHVDGVNSVIHYDPPADGKDYVHRSGRTARAGASGTVISFLDKPQVADAKKMCKRLGIDIELEEQPEAKARTSRPEAVRNRYDPKPNSSNQRKPRGKAGTRSGGKPGGSASGKPRNKSDARKTGKPRNKSESASAGRDGATATSGRSRSRADEEQTRPRSERSGSRTKARSGKPDERSGSRSTKTRSGEASSTARSSKPRSSDNKPSKPRSSKPASAKAGSAKSASSRSRSEGTKPSTGRKKSAAKPGARSAATPGGKGPSAGKAKAKAKPKRSGKPRPKNRKKLPKGARRA